MKDQANVPIVNIEDKMFRSEYGYKLCLKCCYFVINELFFLTLIQALTIIHHTIILR